jgi:hypothetical protein
LATQANGLPLPAKRRNDNTLLSASLASIQRKPSAWCPLEQRWLLDIDVVQSPYQLLHAAMRAVIEHVLPLSLAFAEEA